MTWELCWRGLAAGDRNGGPVRLATLLHLSTRAGFDEETVFKAYSDWVFGDGFDTGPTLEQVVKLQRMGLSIANAVKRNHLSVGRTAGIGPAHRSAGLLGLANGEELIALAQREALLTHLDPIAGQCSALSLMICEQLLQGVSVEMVERQVAERWPFIPLRKEPPKRNGYAPDVIAAAWYFLQRADNFREGLEASLAFAGAGNYCPVLVGLWAACRFGEVPDECLQHPMCPPSASSIELH